MARNGVSVYDCVLMLKSGKAVEVVSIAEDVCDVGLWVVRKEAVNCT